MFKFNLNDLQEQKGHKALSRKELLEKAEKAEGGPRPLTPEEIEIFDRLTVEIGKLEDQIAEKEKHNRRVEENEKFVAKLDEPRGRVAVPDQPGKPDVPATTQPLRIPANCMRTGTLKAFKPRHGESTHDANLRAFRSGKWIRATVFNDERAQQWCTTHGVPLPGNIRNAMSTSSNTDGGFLVMDEMADAIIDLRETYGIFRQNCRVWPMGSDTLMIPRRLAGVTIGAIGENPASAISQSSPTFNQVQLVAKKAGGLSLLSNEIADDAVIDIADWIAQEFAYGFALFEDQCGFTGDGTSTYLGIRGLTNYLTEANAATYAGAVTVATATHDLFSEIDHTDLTTLMGKLPQFALPNAKWYCSNVAKSLVFDRLLAVAGGNNVMTLQGTTGASYLGYPIVVSQVLPTATTTLDALPMLFFGDLRKSSSLGDRRQIRIFPSEHRYMDTDQIGIRGTERFDIVNHDLGDGTTAGPIVALTGSTS